MTVLRNINTIILHTPKTGGSSVRWPAIKKFGIKYSCQHCDYKMLPEKYKNYRKITFIRNPLDWYASRYFFDKKKFQQKQKKLEPFTDALSNDYKLSFKETLPNMMNLTNAFRNPKILNHFKKRIQREVTNNYQCWWVSYFDDIDSLTPEYFENKSLYKWFLDIIGIEHADAIYRLEDQYEYGMKKEFGNDINLIHKNKTKRTSSGDLYTDSIKKMVIDVEQKFIQKYKYQQIIKEI